MTFSSKSSEIVTFKTINAVKSDPENVMITKSVTPAGKPKIGDRSDC